MADQFTKLQLQNVMSASGAELADSTTRTSLLHSSGKLTIPKGFLYVGKTLRVRASGKCSNVVTTPGTLTLDLDLLNPTPAHVIAVTSQAMGLCVVAKSNVTWWLEWILRCSSIGSGTSAKFEHQGKWTSESVVGSPLPSAGGSGSLNIPASSPADGTGFDSTVDQVLDLFATFSVNTTGTKITCHQFIVDTLG